MSTQTMQGHDSLEQTKLMLEKLHHDCFGWALVCCRWNRDDALEALQTSYVRILEGTARLNGQPGPRAWVLGVIRMTALEQRRRRLTRGLLLGRWLRLTPEPAVADPAVDVERGERHAMLRKALSHLSGRQRDLLHLVFYQDMTIEEAAEVLGISLGAARAHYERGKARLRRLLAQSR